MTKGIYIRTSKMKENIGKSSKGRNTLAWYIKKYGDEEGNCAYKRWCKLRKDIATGRKSSIKGKTYEEFYGTKVAGEIKKKCIKSHLGKKQTTETKLKRSLSMTGRVFDVSSIDKMSATRKAKFLTGELVLSPRAGCGKGGFKKDIGHYIRSSYEHNFAKFLNQMGISYKYEPKHFEVFVDNKSTSFTPDFCINKTWFEIKNSFNVKDEKFNKKLKSFKDIYKNENIYIVVGNSKDVRTWTIMEEQKDLVKILHKLTPILRCLAPCPPTKGVKQMNKVYCKKCRYYWGGPNNHYCEHPSCYKTISSPISEDKKEWLHIFADDKNANNDCKDFKRVMIWHKLFYPAIEMNRTD